VHLVVVVARYLVPSIVAGCFAHFQQPPGFVVVAAGMSPEAPSVVLEHNRLFAGSRMQQPEPGLGVVVDNLQIQPATRRRLPGAAAVTVAAVI